MRRLWPMVLLAAIVGAAGESIHAASATNRVWLSVAPSAVAAPQTVTARIATNLPDVRDVNVWIENPLGHWRQQLEPARAVWSLALHHAGSYLIRAYAFSGAAWQQREWAAGVPSNAVAVFVGARATLAVSQSAAPVGHAVELIAHSHGISHPRYQFWVENPEGRWSVRLGYSRQRALWLPLSQPGRYRVIAYVKAANAPATPQGALPTAEQTVVAYGSPAAMTITPSQTVWVADNRDRAQLTLTVTDAEGDLVRDANGQAALTLIPPAGGLVSVKSDAGWQPIASKTTLSIPIVAGQGTLTLRAGPQPGPVTLSASWPGLSAAVTIVQTPQVATAIRIAPQNAFLIANESGNPAQFLVQVDDQAGFPMLSGTYSLSARIAGDTGQFHNLTQGPVPLTVVGGNGPTALTVYSIAAGLGPMTLDVRGPGLLGAQVTIPAILGGQPEQLGVSAATTTLMSGQSTVLTFTQLTATGGVSDPASLDNGGYTVHLETAQGMPVSGGFTLNGMPYTAPMTFPTAVGPNAFYAVSQPVTLAVTGAPPGVYQLFVTDPDGLLKPSQPVLFTVLNGP